ncbi:alpha/beta fold hydrolase [Streptomyces termitum]|uniref:O-methylpimelyl-ACP methylesterase n=1 Tax=Streptomyces termitum TaxID=67368 RepID=A0A918WAR3_9ACTN|nr:alpha/beta fold hydrolase [Streptomyces termitum]GHA90233.1 O-methylpimelyl-ACP methylesterase [Streptomyces termitum]
MAGVTAHRAVLGGGRPDLPYARTGRSGDGPPLVLVHGYADSWWAFEPVLRALPAAVRAYAPTQRGHGDADAPEEGYLPEDFADDLVALLDHLGIERAVLVGGSSGGVPARLVAGRRPDRVAGLVLLGTPALLADKPAATALWETVRTLEDPVDRAFVEGFVRGPLAGRVAPGHLETLVEESMKLPARVWRETLRGLLETDLAATLTGILVPTLVVWGDRDPLLTRADQQLILDAVPDSRLLVHEGAGHLLYGEDPERVARELTAFAAAPRG